MEQRSEALRLASIRKKNQINEVQTAKDIQMKQQQDRIQKELIKSQKQEEAALQGLEKLRLKRIERKYIVDCLFFCVGVDRIYTSLKNQGDINDI